MAGETHVARGDPEELIVTVRTGEREHPLRHIAYHSPTGMDPGYPGSGPADLALSVLVDALGEGPQWRTEEGCRAFRTVPEEDRA